MNNFTEEELESIRACYQPIREHRKYTVPEFVKYCKEEKKYICYCEAVIMPDGMIVPVRPSHVETLVDLHGVPRQKLWEEMIPVQESPIHWLIEETGCTSLWYDKMMYSSKGMTKKQKAAVKRLTLAGVIKLQESWAVRKSV